MPLRILLTNDDGVDAPGLAALQRSVELALQRGCVAADVVTVAPDRGRSECGHSVTNGRELKLKLLRTNVYCLDGTPVDCVRVATNTVMRNPDCVLSGVNAGANLGIDLLVSGTFAAAREAASQGINAMALSHYRRPDVAKTWDHVPDWACETLVEFLTRERGGEATLWNLNFPAIEGTAPRPARIVCGVDHRAMPRTACSAPPFAENQESSASQFGITFDLDFHGRPRKIGSDVDQCFGGKITLSKLRFAVG